jgi:hypothetical protein
MQMKRLTAENAGSAERRQRKEWREEIEIKKDTEKVERRESMKD